MRRRLGRRRIGERMCRGAGVWARMRRRVGELEGERARLAVVFAGAHSMREFVEEEEEEEEDAILCAECVSSSCTFGRLVLTRRGRVMVVP